jgi:hypothetical protein
LLPLLKALNIIIKLRIASHPKYDNKIEKFFHSHNKEPMTISMRRRIASSPQSPKYDNKIENCFSP